MCSETDPLRWDCPFHAGVRQVELLESHFGIPLPAKLPFFPCAGGAAVSKAAVVSALEATVRSYGGLTHGGRGEKFLGGHSFRVTGAQWLASLGVEVVKIIVLARWAGDMVLRYIKEASLACLHEDVKALESRRESLKMIQK